MTPAAVRLLDPFSDVAKLEHLSNSDMQRDTTAVLGDDNCFNLAALRVALAAVPPTTERTPGSGERASLARMGLPGGRMSPALLKRFTKKIRIYQLDWITPCWLWQGGTHDKGYGRFHLGFLDGVRVTAYTHRISFEHWIGPLPEGYIGDHQCNHKVCCNPTHIWPETNVNNLRLADQRRPWVRRNQYSQE